MSYQNDKNINEKRIRQCRFLKLLLVFRADSVLCWLESSDQEINGQQSLKVFDPGLTDLLDFFSAIQKRVAQHVQYLAPNTFLIWSTFLTIIAITFCFRSLSSYWAGNVSEGGSLWSMLLLIWLTPANQYHHHYTLLKMDKGNKFISHAILWLYIRDHDYRSGPLFSYKADACEPSLQDDLSV